MWGDTKRTKVCTRPFVVAAQFESALAPIRNAVLIVRVPAKYGMLIADYIC